MSFLEHVMFKVGVITVDLLKVYVVHHWKELSWDSAVIERDSLKGSRNSHHP